MFNRERLRFLKWFPSSGEGLRARCVSVLHIGVSASVGAAIGFGIFLSPLVLTSRDCLLPNIRIDGHEVGGCRAEAIRDFLHEALTPAKLWVVTPERTWTVVLDEAGGAILTDDAVDQAMGLRNTGGLLERAWRSWDTIRHGRDLHIATCWDREKLRTLLQKIAWVTNRPPSNADLTLRNGKFIISASQPGLRMDLDATVRRIAAEYATNRRRHEAVYVEVAPRIHEADLRCDYEVLSTFTTRFPARKRNRTSNLKLALSRLRGGFVMPGEIFSFNQEVGERTRDKGYLVADIFVNHEVVPGIGGGVCQVSTTLYGAVRQAGLKIVERHKHSLPVTYVGPGRDATVSYPYRDFKFQNNTPNPVLVDGRVEGNALTVQLWGSRTPRTAAMRESVRS